MFCLFTYNDGMHVNFFFSIKFIKYTNKNFDYAKLTKKKINPIFRV